MPIDARDVLDANATTARKFMGRIVGHYRRTGPNSWDPYQFVREDGGEIEVLHGIRVQVEDWGAQFRMRNEGRVVRVQWTPTDDEETTIRRRYGDDRQRCFEAELFEGLDEGKLGAAAIIARELS